MKQFFLLIFVMIGTVAAAQQHGKEYHVSMNGDNSNDGSWQHPLKTISAAAAMAMPGDVITVHAGVYRERITPPRGGDSDTKRITYQAAKGERVEIKGSEIVKGWKRLQKDTWEAVIPNTLFGDFNPYKELIHGDWFWPKPKDRQYHRGAVYLNGSWLMEAASQEQALSAADAGNPLWWAVVDSANTTIQAQFKGVDPNSQLVEINVRPVVFYPDKPFINFITVRGFVMEHAATNWAPPTAEQMGLIGTHWSRGWIIENNTIQYSKCVGIALGKYGDTFDNKDTESAEGYVGTIKRALAFGWNKGTIGGHVVRDNIVAYCEQTGIVGSLGCSFSLIQHNTIHDIHVHKLFDGAEMAGIKFHGAIDVQIINNHIYNTNMGIWLDWMAQGAQLQRNLMHDNGLDIFLEVNHGPMLVSNNILLSATSLLMNSSGAAFVHNIFGGKMDVIHYDSRMTPFMLSHSTFVQALHDNPDGDIRFFNNLFVRGGNASQYSSALLPVSFKGNVYTKGATGINNAKLKRGYGEMDQHAQEKMQRYKEQAAKEESAVLDTTFDADARLVNQGADIFLEMNINKNWLNIDREMITTEGLGKALIPGLFFENPDGSLVKISTDYAGKQRKLHPAPGPFEMSAGGKLRFKVW
ncbi:right-handed parallel beta-helix repeat-containing protein [Chitinophaga polysaccharea]|nr:right-handed parallel beta-helix repeat-containing protein [Chitinophaga polysaccharea]